MLPALCLLQGTVGAPSVRFLLFPPAFSFALSSLNLKPLSLLSSTFSPLPAEKRLAQHCDGGDSHTEPVGKLGCAEQADGAVETCGLHERQD